MKMTKNKGVSFIEILVAVVIFAICVTPILMQLNSSNAIGRRADRQQAATDKAQDMAEAIKQMELTQDYTESDIESLLGLTNVSVTKSFYTIDSSYNLSTKTTRGNLGSTVTTVEEAYQKVNAYNAVPSHASNKIAFSREYTFTGKANISGEDMDVTVQMDTDKYALQSLTDAGYSDPNSDNLYNLSNLDATKTAVITSVSNYDTVATATFFNAVVSGLERSSNASDKVKLVQIQNGNRSIGDTATKHITITVNPITSSSAGYKYEVICELTYTNDDPFNVIDEDTIHYEAYHQQFKDLPDVYLMYNQFLYNKKYGSDVIQVVNNTSDDVKTFVIRTAETDANFKNMDGGNTVTGDSLIPTDTSNERDRKSGNRYMYTTDFQIDSSDLGTIEIYTNIPGTSDLGSKLNVNDTSNRHKMSLITNGSATPSEVIYPLNADNRYSDVGRIYNVVITIEKDGKVMATFESAKGDN